MKAKILKVSFLTSLMMTMVMGLAIHLTATPAQALYCHQMQGCSFEGAQDIYEGGQYMMRCCMYDCGDPELEMGACEE